MPEHSLALLLGGKRFGGSAPAAPSTSTVTSVSDRLTINGDPITISGNDLVIPH